MKKIIHILPTNGIGGVELAAKSSIGIRSDRYSFEVKYLSLQKNNINFMSKIYSVFESLFTTIQIIYKAPDYIILSLWKSCLAGFLISIFRPKVKLILFLHLPKSTNFFDYQITKLVSKKVFEVWGDSHETLNKRCLELSINNSITKRKISFKTKNIEINESQKTKNLNFIFWGRIHKQKRLDKAIKLFSEIAKKEIIEFRFSILGPDCGDKKYLKKLVKKYKLEKKINFLPPMRFEEILELSKDYSFFIQLSDTEGMGMSVLESMQLGLIPIVTRVGEISKYCEDGKNSIIFKNPFKTSIEILELYRNKNKFLKIRKNVLNTWQKDITYKEDLMKKFKKII